MNTFLTIEIVENEENNPTNPVNNHYSRAVYIVYTICIKFLVPCTKAK